MINVWTTFTLAVMNLPIDNGGFVLTVIKAHITKGRLTDMRQKAREAIYIVIVAIWTTALMDQWLLLPEERGMEKLNEFGFVAAFYIQNIERAKKINYRNFTT